MNTLQAHSTPPDNAFYSNEYLFHAVQKSHVKDGKIVLPDAIRLPCFSCNREKYRNFPEAVLAIFADKPHLEYLYVATIMAGDMPAAESVDGQTFWETIVAHLPTQENYSHSEIRVKRVGKEYDPDARIKSKPLKLALKASIAGKMRVRPRYGPS